MKGILMLEILYNRTIYGQKTQTRRSGGLQEVNENPDEWRIDSIHHSLNDLALFYNRADGKGLFCKARYNVYEIVYIKEPTLTLEDGSVLYAYDLPEDWRNRNKSKLSNKLFMGADKARRFIQITDIKCERLLDISNDDCIKEGILGHHIGDSIKGWMNYLTWNDKDKRPSGLPLTTPQESFFSLFRLANKIKKSAPLDNPWVFVYSYKLVQKPV